MSVDAERRDLGEKRYLLSPQDLAAVNDIPALIDAGVCSPSRRPLDSIYVAYATQILSVGVSGPLAFSLVDRSLRHPGRHYLCSVRDMDIVGVGTPACYPGGRGSDALRLAG